MYIPALPKTLSCVQIKGLDFETLFQNRQKCLYFDLGRTALYKIAEFVNRAEGEILLPSFICKEAIDPFRDCAIKYYKVNKDLSVDLDDIKAKATGRTKALLIVHYFGFPQDLGKIKKYCCDHNLLLIEDCSQALFSKYKNVFLGSTGDLSVFSFRKTLPLPDGGGLIINNTEITFIANDSKKPGIILEIKKLLKVIRNILSFKFSFSLNCLGFSGGHSSKRPKYVDRSTISRLIMKITNLECVISKRRANYILLSRLVSGIAEISIMNSALPVGVCPLGLLLLHNDRNKILRFLLDQGIEAYPWTPLNNDINEIEYKDARFLSDHLLVLPVHQDLGEKHMQLIAKKLKEAVDAK